MNSAISSVNMQKLNEVLREARQRANTTAVNKPEKNNATTALQFINSLKKADATFNTTRNNNVEEKKIMPFLPPRIKSSEEVINRKTLGTKLDLMA